MLCQLDALGLGDVYRAVFQSGVLHGTEWDSAKWQKTCSMRNGMESICKGLGVRRKQGFGVRGPGLARALEVQGMGAALGCVS